MLKFIIAPLNVLHHWKAFKIESNCKEVSNEDEKDDEMDDGKTENKIARVLMVWQKLYKLIKRIYYYA